MDSRERQALQHLIDVVEPHRRKYPALDRDADIMQRVLDTTKVEREYPWPKGPLDISGITETGQEQYIWHRSSSLVKICNLAPQLAEAAVELYRERRWKTFCGNEAESLALEALYDLGKQIDEEIVSR